MEYPGIKICLLGNSGVGKSAIIQRCIRDDFDLNYENTVGVCFFKHDINVNGEYYTLKIWDTAGQERFRVISRLYYRDAKGVIIVYDITLKDSFVALKNWVREVRQMAPPNIVIAIAGNKSDLTNCRAISYDDGQKYANEIGALFMETSALTSQNVKELFYTMVNRMSDKIQEKNTEVTPLIKLNPKPRKTCCF
ncbi:ras-related protein Rab-22A-like isoform X1 [Centruroides vittatus]|uniref:ras-related protein Rab-22A-like isoform X1 n=1 Tax=Centruroides vittatus TaxID=120091 RepID=UPI003510B2CC